MKAATMTRRHRNRLVLTKGKSPCPTMWPLIRTGRTAPHPTLCLRPSRWRQLLSPKSQPPLRAGRHSPRKVSKICPLESIPRLKPQQRSPTSYALLCSRPSRPRSPPSLPRLFLYRQAPSTRHTSCPSGLHSFTNPRLMNNHSHRLAKHRRRTHRLTLSTPVISLFSRFSSFWISNGFCH